MHSNNPGVTHAVNEFDNPKNKPNMGKSSSKSHSSKAVSVPSEPGESYKKFGKKEDRKQKIVALLAKARKGK